jgi:hypothetical protein
MIGNNIVKFCLRTPLHVILGDTMLITVTGRKTGRKYTTPVGFYRENGVLWVLTRRDRTWWRNACGAQVTLRLHGRELPAYAESILDERAVAMRLDGYLRHIPLAARALGVSSVQGVPDREALARLAKDRLLVKVKPAGVY